MQYKDRALWLRGRKMKFGNLYWQNTNMADSDVVAVNFGDNLQFMAIDYLYSVFLPDTQEVVKLQLNEIRDYRGEDIILPLNWNLFDRAFMDGNRIDISENILPVFLGMTIESYAYKESFFNDYNIAYLKRHEPIGCRDAHTVDVLRQYHIRAYLNGCLTSVFPKREKIAQNRIVFVDVPIGLLPYIPEGMKGQYEVMTQQHYFDQSVSVENVLDKVKAQYRKYAEEAGLVVTSRLHVASPCMAMGIPVIFVKDRIDARFGWLDAYIPLYDREHFDRIEWNPRPIEYEDKKEVIIQNAVKRILNVYENDIGFDAVEAVYRNRKKKEYINFQQTIYNNFEKATLFLQKNYSQKDNFVYSIWGINDAAENFYTYMCREYPNAELKCVIDKYKSMEFHGKQTIKPEEICWEDGEIIFILPVKASNEAMSVLEGKKVDRKYYICCGDQFIGCSK